MLCGCIKEVVGGGFALGVAPLSWLAVLIRGPSDLQHCCTERHPEQSRQPWTLISRSSSEAALGFVVSADT